jgi:hypothetical protein
LQSNNFGLRDLSEPSVVMPGQKRAIARDVPGILVLMLAAPGKDGHGWNKSGHDSVEHQSLALKALSMRSRSSDKGIAAPV